MTMARNSFKLAPIPIDADGNPLPSMPACEVCGLPAEMCIVHLKDGNTEWVCYGCHTTTIADMLTALAAAEAGAGRVEADGSAGVDVLSTEANAGRYATRYG
jgi:hypothetical protein